MESHAPQLVILQGTDAGKVIPLTSAKLVIGRTKGDLLIADARMSRAHVEIEWDAATGTLRFRDLKSLNGTLWNDKPTNEGVLANGDKIRLGDTVLEVRLPARAQASTRATTPSVPTPTESRRMNAEPVILPLDGGEDEAPAPESPKENKKADVPTKPTGAVKPMFQTAVDDAHAEREKSGRGLGRLFARFRRHRSAEPVPSTKAAAPTKASDHAVPEPKKSRRVRVYALLALLLAGVYYYTHHQAGGSARGEADAIRQLLQQGKTEEALQAATNLKDKNPQSSEAWLVLGDVQLSSGRADLAIFSYEQAKKSQPPLALSHARLMRAYLRSQMLPQAEEEMRAIDNLIKKGETAPEFLEETAMILLEHKELKQPPEKTVVLAKALQVEFAPNSTVGYRLESQVLLDQGRAQEALPVIDKGLGIDPNDEWLLENGTFAHLSMKDIPGATKTVDMWIQKKPNSTKARLIMSYLLFNQQNATAALPHLQKIMELSGEKNEKNDPHYAEALDLVGQIRQQQNQMDDANAFFERACQAGFSQSCERIRNPAGNAPPQEAPPGAGAPPGETANPQ